MQFKWHSSLTLKAVIYREEIIFHVAANWKRTFICVTNTFLPFSETLLCHQNAIFMYATNPQQWRAQSTGKTGVAPIKSFLHYSWRWKPAIMLPPVLNTLHAFVKTFRRHFRQLVCNRWCIIEQTSDIQHNKDRYCCSVCVFCRKHASLPTGIALNMCVVLKML